MPTRRRAANAKRHAANLPADEGDTLITDDDNNDAASESTSQAPAGQMQHSSQQSEKTVWDWEIPATTTTTATTTTNLTRSSSYSHGQQGLLLDGPSKKKTLLEFSNPHQLTPSHVETANALVEIGGGGGGGGAADPPRWPSVSTRSAAGMKRKSTIDQELSLGPKRTSVEQPEAGEQMVSPSDSRPTALSSRQLSQSGPLTGKQHRSADDVVASAFDAENGGAQAIRSASKRGPSDQSTATTLPPRKVFPVQVGDKLFRLSGGSISSDAPSYISQFFEDSTRQNDGNDNLRTLYVDRDPATFEDIALHLQGYHVEPRDGPHFVRLLADAQYFNLPKLTAQLFASTIYIRIGDSEFQIHRDLFNNPGDSPNFFSLGFALFSPNPQDSLAGPIQRAPHRPGPILPPSVPNRSAKTFADILHILKGYPIEVRSEAHRAELLRDARYFHLKGLEQRLIPHEISYNLARQTSEIIIRLEDIRQSGISFAADSSSSTSSAAPSPTSSSSSNAHSGPGWVLYQRPYVDNEAYTLIVEISADESSTLSIAPASKSNTRFGRANFYGQTLGRITSLFSVIATKMPTSASSSSQNQDSTASVPVSPGSHPSNGEERVKVRIGNDADVIVNGKRWLFSSDGDDDSSMDVDTGQSSMARSGTRRKSAEPGDREGVELVLKKSQWRIRVQPSSGGVGQVGGRTGIEIMLGAVKIDGISNERARNASRGFLGG